MERSENTGLFGFGFVGRATMGSYVLFECWSETPRKYHALTPGELNQTIIRKVPVLPVLTN
jgi:hypothetical protein